MDRNRSIIEWTPGKIDNIGVISIFPAQIFYDYLLGKNIFEIINLFWSRDATKISLLDICTLMQMWWTDKSIIAARYSLLHHPSHHSSEIILDRSDSRAIITFRQPDINGKHWRANHIHIVRGEIDPSDPCHVIKRNFDKHTELFRRPINGYYIIKVK